MKLQKPTIGFAVLSITALVLSCITLAMILFKDSVVTAKQADAETIRRIEDLERLLILTGEAEYDVDKICKACEREQWRGRSRQKSNK